MARHNSLGGGSSGGQRSNSLKTYSYHPKGSYTPGQATIPNARRFSSLTSNSQTNVNHLQTNYNNLRPPVDFNNRSSSITSTGSRNSRHLIMEKSQPRAIHEGHGEEFDQDGDQEGDQEGDTIITTQTTKVVDNQGRVQSITTKTIKTLPDGSNIIETTTKNISRSNSLRNNSLRNNSLRANSLLNSPKDTNYNLQKIDEDLQDFEYDYEVDNAIPSSNHDLPKSELNFPPQSDHHHHKNHYSTSPPQAELNHPDLVHNAEALRSEGSPNNKSEKPLKSILKSPKTNFEVVDDIEYESINHSAPTSPKHPYKTIGHPLSEPPHFKVPAVPLKKSPPKTSPIKESRDGKDKEINSNASATSGSSIKFNDNVETIPIYNDYPRQKVSNQELYNKAMQVAIEKVYGSKNTEPTNNQHQPTDVPTVIPQKTIDKKDKQDKKLQVLGHSGINDNYIYENHHKDFKLHSLRGGGNEDEGSTRKERLKLEKMQRKEQEKQLKEEEKRKKDELKQQKKDQKRKSPIRGLFGRKKKDDDSNSLGGQSFHSYQSEGVLNGSPRNSQPQEITSMDKLDESIIDYPASASIPENESPQLQSQAKPKFQTRYPDSESDTEQPNYQSLSITEDPLKSATVTQNETKYDASQGLVNQGPVPHQDITKFESLPSPNLNEPSVESTNAKSIDKPVDTESISKETLDPMVTKFHDRKSSNDFKQPVIISRQASKSNISEPEISTPMVIGNSPKNEINNVEDIPIPTLNEVSGDDNLDDSGVLTDMDEYEDVLTSPVSESRKVSRNNSVKSPVQSAESSNEFNESKAKDVIKKPSEEPISEVVENDDFKHVMDEDYVESKRDDAVDNNNDNDTIMDKTLENPLPQPTLHDKSNQDINQHSLSNIIRLSQETPDVGFQPPNAYDSDSDASSKFSADLSAAIRRITDNPTQDEELDHPENREAYVIDEPLVSKKPNNVKIYEPISNSHEEVMTEPSSAFASPTEDNFKTMGNKNDSGPQTESSDDRSPQPSRSTLATNDKPINHDIPHLTVDENGVISNVKPKKTKRKFGEKILKLFVNSYDG